MIVSAKAGSFGASRWPPRTVAVRAPGMRSAISEGGESSLPLRTSTDSSMSSKAMPFNERHRVIDETVHGVRAWFRGGVGAAVSTEVGSDGAKARGRQGLDDSGVFPVELRADLEPVQEHDRNALTAIEHAERDTIRC